jgi:hypothetical protein
MMAAKQHCHTAHCRGTAGTNEPRRKQRPLQDCPPCLRGLHACPPNWVCPSNLVSPLSRSTAKGFSKKRPNTVHAICRLRQLASALAPQHATLTVLHAGVIVFEEDTFHNVDKTDTTREQQTN